VIASGLDPDFLPLMLAHRQLDLAAGIPFVLISGRRGYDQQAGLRADYEAKHAAWTAAGRTGPEPKPAAKPGGSKHEIGWAYDRAGPRSAHEWEQSAQHAESLGLEAGLRYSDAPHFEAREPLEHLRTMVAMRVAATLALVGVGVLIARGST
jgi:hypothetical protein